MRRLMSASLVRRIRWLVGLKVRPKAVQMKVKVALISVEVRDYELMHTMQTCVVRRSDAGCRAGHADAKELAGVGPEVDALQSLASAQAVKEDDGHEDAWSRAVERQERVAARVQAVQGRRRQAGFQELEPRFAGSVAAGRTAAAGQGLGFPGQQAAQPVREHA